MARTMTYSTAAAVIVAGLVMTGGPARAAIWENNPATLCEMDLLKDTLDLSDKQLEAIKPILAELTRELQRWSWRNDAKYDKIVKDFLAASAARKTGEACDLMNKKKAVENDRKAVVDRFKRKIFKLLTDGQKGTLEGYKFGQEMVARNRRWRLSDEQVEQIRKVCFAQGVMLSDFKEHADLRAIAKVRASTERHIVEQIFTDAQRARLEGPVRSGKPPKTREQLSEEQKQRVEMAVRVWAGKRHMEEVKRTRQITQQMADMMVAHNIRMAQKAWEDLQRLHNKRISTKDKPKGRRRKKTRK